MIKPAEWHSVDRFLIIPKLLYFLLNFLLYSTYTFTAKYFDEAWGVAIHQFGYIVGLCALSFTGSLIWTWVADSTKRHRIILIGATIGYALTFSMLKLEFFLRDWSERNRLITLISLYGASNYCSSALFPLVDNRVMVILDGNFEGPEKSNLFGRQRLFGVLGNSVVTLLNGYLIRFYGFDAMFYCIAISAAIFIIAILLFIPSDHSKTSSESKPPSHTHPNNKIPSSSPAKILAIPSFSTFLIGVLLCGTTRGVIGNYLPPFLEKSLNFSTFQISLILQTRNIAEILVFFIVPLLLKRFGYASVLLLGHISGSIRVAAYAFLPYHSPWRYSAAIVELFKGISNACIVSAGVQYVHYVVRGSGLEASAQGFFSGTHSYLANALSGFFGGLVLQFYGLHGESFRQLFLMTWFVSLGGIMISIVGQRLMKHQKREKEEDGLS